MPQRNLYVALLLSSIPLVAFVLSNGKFAVFAGTLSSHASWAVAPYLREGVYQRHLQQWRKFAESLNASTSEADYLQIHKSLDIFRGGINHSDVRRAGSFQQAAWLKFI